MQSADKHNDLCRNHRRSYLPAGHIHASYIEAESTRFFALRELHQVGDAVELFDQKLLDRRRGEFRLFHISLPPDERLLRHSPSAVPIGSAVQMRDFR